jgi:hypothetical protein
MANYGTKTFNLYEKRDPIRRFIKKEKISIPME